MLFFSLARSLVNVLYMLSESECCLHLYILSKCKKWWIASASLQSKIILLQIYLSRTKEASKSFLYSDFWYLLNANIQWKYELEETVFLSPAYVPWDQILKYNKQKKNTEFPDPRWIPLPSSPQQCLSSGAYECTNTHYFQNYVNIAPTVNSPKHWE